MRQKVFILGATGNVGGELVSQILEDDGIDKNVNPTDIIGIANSTKMIVCEESLNQKLEHNRDTIKEQVSEILNQGKTYTGMTDILDALKHQGYSGEVIIVDVTAAKGEKITKFHLDAISADYGYKIVTANKNIVSLEGQETFDIATKDHGSYDYNTAVMAGAGAVDFVVRSERNNDSVTSIEGCFSGTLGYICCELEKGEKPFSEIVAEAKGLGYTEPNPWDDLNGLDVARKLLILARAAGYNVEMEDLQVEWFIDAKYGDVSEEDFLEAIKAEDISMAKRYTKAQERGKTLKYVASMKVVNGEPKLKVGLQEVDMSSTIGGLQGTGNIAQIETKTYDSSSPFILIAPGAGLRVTALAVRDAISKALPDGLPRRNGV